MMKRPSKCCDVGTFEHQVPTAIKGRRQDIDLCVADIVAALNAANITTTMSCCGHNKHHGTIALEDGRWLIVARREIASASKEEVEAIVDCAFRPRANEGEI